MMRLQSLHHLFLFYFLVRHSRMLKLIWNIVPSLSYTVYNRFVVVFVVVMGCMGILFFFYSSHNH